VVDPALDDLDAVEIAAERVLERGDQEGRGSARWRAMQIAAHRHALAVADLSRGARVRIAGHEIEAAEEPDQDA
jgi:hypothetical protein